MTQIFDEKGHVVPVTLLSAGPVTVTQVIVEEKNGYTAVQVGYGEKRLNKPELGHVKDFAAKNGKGFAILREFRVMPENELKKGDKLDVTQFAVGDRVNVRAATKGKGFQGVVKRWGFKGGPKTHGQKHSLRAPGSIGSGYPQRVIKGLKMGGHMGSANKSVLRLRVAYVNPADNIIGIRGAVPGRRGAAVEIIAR